MDIIALEKKYRNTQINHKVKKLEEELQNFKESNNDVSKLAQELSYYSELSFLISEILKKITAVKEVKEMLKSEEDYEIKELALEEESSLNGEIEILDKKIRELQIERNFSEEDDNRSTIIEIRAGAGGDEASLFAADLFRMYKHYALKKGWEINIIDSSISESGGYKEVIAHIKGKNVYKELKYESGVHRVQRIPVTESSGRIHTSTVSVAILPEAKDVDIQINPEDLNIDIMRASGAGGQCVNKTDSAVRITHIPTGIVVSCQETRHQSQNREKAMNILRARLYDKKKEEEEKKRGNIRSKLIGSAMRAEKIRTYNFPQNRITDHRIKKSWFNIDAVLNGDLEEMINDVRKGIMNELLKEAEESGG